MNDDPGRCEWPGCDSTHAITWSPLVRKWLCPQSLWVATERELGPSAPYTHPIQPLEETA